MISLKHSTDRRLSGILRKRLEDRVDALEALGYQANGIVHERYGPLAMVLAPIIPILMTLSGERIRLRFPFGFTVATLLYHHSDLHTYCQVYQLQCEFHSFFSDGTTVITSKEGGLGRKEDGSPIHKIACDAPPQQQATRHQQECEWWAANRDREIVECSLPLLQTSAKSQLGILEWILIGSANWFPISAVLYLLNVLRTIDTLKM